jgi:hypothetical protein
MSGTLDDLIAELQDLAEQLRSGDLAPEQAAELVERCAEVAARIGGQLDADSRAAAEAEGQERLL